MISLTKLYIPHAVPPSGLFDFALLRTQRELAWPRRTPWIVACPEGER